MVSLILVIIMISLTSASIEDLGDLKSGNCIQLVQSCATCTYNNITLITYPNQSIALQGQYAMTQNGATYNYTFCNTAALGMYTVSGLGNLDGTPKTFSYIFNVTTTGGNSSMPLFLIIIGLALIFMVIFLITKEHIFGVISGMIFMVTGVFVMIYGIGSLADDYTRAISIVCIGLGLLFTIASAYNWATDDDSNFSEEDED